MQKMKYLTRAIQRNNYLFYFFLIPVIVKQIKFQNLLFTIKF